MFNFQVFEEFSAGDLVLFAFNENLSFPVWAVSYAGEPRRLAYDLRQGWEAGWDPTRDNAGDNLAYRGTAEMIEQYDFICAAIATTNWLSPDGVNISLVFAEIGDTIMRINFQHTLADAASSL